MVLFNEINIVLRLNPSKGEPSSRTDSFTMDISMLVPVSGYLLISLNFKGKPEMIIILSMKRILKGF